MSRRFFVVPAVLALAVSPLAHASDQAAPRISARESIARFAPRIELAELFARIADAGAAVDTEDGVSLPMSSTEVLVARLNTDGKAIMACVDNEESARRFLDASMERVMRGRTQEQ
jgi:type IV secretory pathway VirJ component